MKIICSLMLISFMGVLCASSKKDSTIKLPKLKRESSVVSKKYDAEREMEEEVETRYPTGLINYDAAEKSPRVKIRKNSKEGVQSDSK